ncbi:MAG: membrane protein of unknown function [Promethearchaeota archaeon]|nr:MAG: membrane protein of unknown function [Candidatus Lokiarchaeota archaeon]
MVNNVFCPQCGENLKTLDQQFCKYCGADLKLNENQFLAETPILEKNRVIKFSKKLFVLGLFSVILAIPTAIIGLTLIILWEDYVYLSYLGGVPGSFMQNPNYGFYDENLTFLSVLIGLLLMVPSILGLLFGIISFKWRKKSATNEILSKISNGLAIIGIISTIFAIIISFILVFLPPFVGFFRTFIFRYRSQGIYTF